MLRPSTKHGARGAVEPRAAAVGAGAGAEIPAELLAHRRRLGLAVAALEVRQDALEGVAPALRLAARVAVAELDRLVAAAVEQRVLHGLRQLGPGRLDVEVVVPASDWISWK